MGLVAAVASHGQGSVYVLSGELGLVMTLEAELVAFGLEELRCCSGVGIMASGAAHGDGGMHGFPRELGLVMALEAEFIDLALEQFGGGR